MDAEISHWYSYGVCHSSCTSVISHEGIVNVDILGWRLTLTFDADVWRWYFTIIYKLDNNLKFYDYVITLSLRHRLWCSMLMFNCRRLILMIKFIVVVRGCLMLTLLTLMIKVDVWCISLTPWRFTLTIIFIRDIDACGNINTDVEQSMSKFVAVWRFGLSLR